MTGDVNALALNPGARFNERYQIVRRIAAGGMGAVYEVIHLDTQRPRALKVMLPQLVSNDALRERFKQEATVVSQVHSQHIVEITDAGVDAATGSPFIVMELLIGQNLQQMVETRGPLPLPEIVELLRQAALALDKTHAAGIIHRDLKPENLFVTRRDDGSPHVKVLDFGIAKVVQNSLTSGQQTATIGTPAFMAPEQIRDKGQLGPPTDVYALAHVAYALMVGEAYFTESLEQAENAYQIMMSVSHGGDESARMKARRRRAVELPEGIDTWFSKATSINPTVRYQSCGELVAALAQAAGTPVRQPSVPNPQEVASMATDVFMEHVNSQQGQPPMGQAGATAPGAPGPGVPNSGPTVNAAPATLVGPPIHPGGSTTTSPAITDMSPPTAGGGNKRSPVVLIAAAVLFIGGGAGAFALTQGEEGPAAKLKEGMGKTLTKLADATPKPISCPSGMLKVDGVTFRMGAAGVGDEDVPVHDVTVDAFCLDETEVTAGDYQKCVVAGQCEKHDDIYWENAGPADHQREDEACTLRNPAHADHPINCVDWADAKAYCAFAKKRLPTEAEWELAARGKDGHAYPWGAATPTANVLNACGEECRKHFNGIKGQWKVIFENEDGFPTTAPVGKYPDGKGPFGHLDLAGNVNEWTADYFAPYPKNPVHDPKVDTKPSDNRGRVARGGSFMSYSPDAVHAGHRVAIVPDKRSTRTGFRCAR